MNDKRYVFLQSQVCGVGGAQMYAIEKAKWLRGEGWKPAVLYAVDGDVVLDYGCIELRRCEMLFVRPGALPKKRVNKITNEIASWLEGADEIVFETNVIDFAVWGELFAEKTEGINFVFSLGEKPPITSVQERAFYWDKYKRGEFASITESFLNSLLQKYDAGYSRVILCAHEGSAVADVAVPDDLQIFDCDYAIGIVSRLEKSFVIDAAKGIALFSKRHPSDSIACYLVGGNGDQAAISAIKKCFSGCENIRLVFTGELSPLPRKLLGSFDVAIAKAGCVDCCLESGTLTVKYQMDSDIPQGVVLYDIPRNAKEAYDPTLALDDYLEKLLVNAEYKNKKAKYQYSRKIIDFSPHQDFLNCIAARQPMQKPRYLTGRLPKPPLLKRAIAAIAVLTGKYPNELRKNLRQLLNMPNG